MDSFDVGTAIIGSGFSGLGMAIRLKQEGIEDFTMLERGDDVGGTWHYNTYPGCACDVPSHLYSFSFAPNPTWSQTYSPQPEIRDYLHRCADEFGIRPHERLTVFQRTPPWVMPHPNRPITKLERRLYARFPALQKATRAGVYVGRETF